ncbi:MAG TPA: response regulator [Gemmatimonadales bacterium]|jgi:DNA-binding response OmpR family regulator|nr:response regulator [Gemmatimonadales bacterium]
MARILIIDDEEGIRRPLQRVLERAGHEVLAASDGQEGLRLWRKVGADLVITDVMMPNKNGIETILELRTSIPQVPVIAMSGGDVSQRLDLLGNATLLGAVYTMLKPFSLSEMLEKVAEVLREAPARRSGSHG